MRAPFSRYGQLDMDSMPPATTTSDSPSCTACAASADGFQSGAANFVDGHGCDARVETAAQRRLPRGILPEARLDHVAQDRFVHQIRLDTGAAHNFGDDFRAKLASRKEARARP